MKEVVLDTETTGISIKEGHRIVEIGCIELENLIPTTKKFHCFLNPERKVSEKALEVHGYTDQFLSDKKKFKEIEDEFLDFINGKRLIIHNAEFDISHLNNELSSDYKEKPIRIWWSYNYVFNISFDIASVNTNWEIKFIYTDGTDSGWLLQELESENYNFNFTTPDDKFIKEIQFYINGDDVLIDNISLTTY